MDGFNRRDVLKVGLFGGAALALPLERVASARSGTGRIATSKLPKPFTVPFSVPPVASPVPTTDATTDHYELTMRSNQVEILPGLKTELWAYDGIPAGPPPGAPSWRVRTRSYAAESHCCRSPAG
jgi:hypothetical protein